MLQEGRWFASILPFEDVTYTLTATHDGSTKTGPDSYNIYRSLSANARDSGDLIASIPGDENAYVDNLSVVPAYNYQITAVYGQGESVPSNEVSVVITSVDTWDAATLPQRFALPQNYPNPFNPGTQIQYDLPRAAHVRLEVFNLLGQKVKTLVDRRELAGSHSVMWDGPSRMAV
jgi:hypothetical protein